MKLKLTIKSVQKLEPKESVYDVWDTDISGFVLRVRPTGTKTYLLFYRNQNGQKRTYTIGKGLTATQARDIAQKKLAEIAHGVDINAHERAIKAEHNKKQSNSLHIFLEKKYAPYLMQNRRDGKSDIKSIKTQFADFMPLQLNEISKWSIQKWQMEKKKLALVSILFNAI